MRAPSVLLLACIFAVSARVASTQAAPEAPKPDAQKPKVRINYLNVCTPAEAEKTALAKNLQRIPEKPHFNADYEVSRGHSTMPDVPPSEWLRVRREFPPDGAFLNAQYSMSVDKNSIVETLVLRVRDPKDTVQISMDTAVSAGAPAVVSTVMSDTPVNRIKVERLVEGSVGLTRCPEADQSAYQQLFDQASLLMSNYRKTLGLRAAFLGDFERLAAATARLSSATDKDNDKHAANTRKGRTADPKRTTPLKPGEPKPPGPR